jgi:alkaline phosphatase
VNSKSRNSQEDIAGQYLDLNFDVMMGGGNQYFAADKHRDKADMYAKFAAKGYQVAKTRTEMMSASNDKPVLGVFGEDAIPYYIDRNNDAELQKNRSFAGRNGAESHRPHEKSPQRFRHADRKRKGGLGCARQRYCGTFARPDRV